MKQRPQVSGQTARELSDSYIKSAVYALSADFLGLLCRFLAGIHHLATLYT